MYFSDVCSTPGCIHAASTVLKYIDESVDPCHNFYKFACGTYIKNTNIPEDKSAVLSFTTIGDTVREQLKTIIEDPLPKESSKPYKLMKKIYDMCMNTTAIEIDSLPYFMSAIKDLGGWPLLDKKWNENKFDWKELVYKLRKRASGVSYFVSLYIGIDDKNSTRRLIHVSKILVYCM